MADLSERAKDRIERVIEQIKARLSASEVAEVREALEAQEREEQERAGGA
jgi:hypothetical protein